MNTSLGFSLILSFFFVLNNRGNYELKVLPFRVKSKASNFIVLDVRLIGHRSPSMIGQLKLSLTQQNNTPFYRFFSFGISSISFIFKPKLEEIFKPPLSAHFLSEMFYPYLLTSKPSDLAHRNLPKLEWVPKQQAAARL